MLILLKRIWRSCWNWWFHRCPVNFPRNATGLNAYTTLSFIFWRFVKTNKIVVFFCDEYACWPVRVVTRTCALVCLQDSSMVRKRDIISSFITEILLALKEVTKLHLVFAQFLNYIAKSVCWPPNLFQNGSVEKH